MPDRSADVTGPRIARSALAAVLVAVAAFVATWVAWEAGGFEVDLPWAPVWDLRLSLELDGLALLYAVLAAGIGAVVFAYASAYVPRHLAHQGRPRGEEARLHGAMVLFLVSMLGLVLARDLILLFVFWDLTAVASWLLIGFDRANRPARLSALMALLVTTITAVLLLIAILVLRSEYGTTQIDELVAVARPGWAVALAGVLIAVAALTKSAQAPLHFWLPRAMAAPTPVSAYLHSAAMVAAGVFLVSRTHPLLALEPALLDGILAVGLASIVVGGLLALWATDLKRLLAYSTISQYGYVATMLGIGGAAGAAGACLYVLVHAIAKSALFMTAGAVTEATGRKELPRLGGLARRMPLLAAGSGAAAATLAALPLTLGFFKDELFFKAAAERGTWLAVAAVISAALTLAYIGRFWGGVFLGRSDATVRPLERRLVWPIAALGALAVAGGLVPGPFAELAQEAADVTAAGPAPVDVAYHADTRTENVMAVAAWLTGALLLAGRARLQGLLSAIARAGQAIGPERLYTVALEGINALSNRIHDVEVRDLRARIAAVLVPASGLIALGVIFTPTGSTYEVGRLVGADVPLVMMLGIGVLAAVAATRPRRHLRLALSLSAVGFALAVVYALLGAADIALVAVLVETLFALLFVGVFSLVPARVLRRESRRRGSPSARLRNGLIAATSGVVTMLVAWGAFSRPIPDDPSAQRHLALADEAHGKDVVTVILADFRGLDTLVEITVVLVAAMAVATLLHGRFRA
ncbi:MAG TPA: hydrogen gas-evolving membrane-bound hydrogenase subunit E [Capillimicrobium sp.]|nr:hydrogen gas-evolving membrane-bound hydrogenase subunit E [Capillimicrobium sp.]